MKAFLGIAAALLALWALTRLLEPRLTWHPLREVYADPATFGLRVEDVAITAADGVRLRGWHVLPPQGTEHRADLLFFNGNAGNIAHRLPKIRALAGLGLGVLIFDYRGFGRSEGSPGDAGILRDADAAFRFARERAPLSAAERWASAGSRSAASLRSGRPLRIATTPRS